LTLEQVDQLFNGIPQSDILNVIEAYNGEKPLSEEERHDGTHIQELAEQPSKV
jgi:hypothetical protein